LQSPLVDINLWASTPVRQPTNSKENGALPPHPKHHVPTTTNSWGWACIHNLPACPLGPTACRLVQAHDFLAHHLGQLHSNLPCIRVFFPEHPSGQIPAFSCPSGQTHGPALGADRRSASRGLKVLPLEDISSGPEDRSRPQLCGTSRTPAAAGTGPSACPCHLVGSEFPPCEVPFHVVLQPFSFGLHVAQAPVPHGLLVSH
jgi:hypothetical protein